MPRREDMQSWNSAPFTWRNMVARDAACEISDVLVEDWKPFDGDGHFAETVEHEVNCTGNTTTCEAD